MPPLASPTRASFITSARQEICWHLPKICWHLPKICWHPHLLVSASVGICSGRVFEHMIRVIASQTQNNAAAAPSLLAKN
jgi:hypothetical protein